MKRSNFSFKLLTIMIAFVIIGCFQLNASQAQEKDDSFRVPVKIFANAYKHIPGLDKDAVKIINTVRKEFNLYERRMNYHRVVIDVVDEDYDAEGDFLVVYFLLKNRYSMEISKITLLEHYEVLWVENDYKLKKKETSTEWLVYEYGTCPDESVEIVLSTCCTSIPTAVEGINYSYNAAVSAGYSTVKLLGSQENTTDIDHWLSCPNLKYWGRIGHGSSTGILLYDGTLSYTYFNSLPAGALQGKSLYFNSCQVFNDPLKSSILNKDAYKYVGGICSLLIGPSEEVFKCWNDHNFYQVPPPGGEPDEMCYWSEECESSTGYPYLGCHGCGGPGLIFPEPGGTEPPLAPSDLTANAVACDQVDLAWTDNSDNESSFKIERSINGIDFSEIDSVGANVTTYSDTTVAEITTYWYRVRASNSAGDSAYSNTASDTTPECPVNPPAAPSNLNAKVKGRKITLTWTDNSDNEDGFNIYRGYSPSTLTLHATVAANVTSYDDANLESKTTYYYKVCAYNVNGEGCSGTVSGTTK
jgi:outer membrane lipoprotein-sorting protein